ncbi:MAG TPA: CdaR family protein [Candidatus Limnocylindria bacterium]|nr:CdaR family protein [Candidatus Limnocylindria bacterium]
MRGPTYAATARGFRRLDLRRAAMHDFPLKAAAFAISVLAFVAVAESSQPATVTFRVPVERPADVPAGYVLRGTLGDTAVTLSGPQSELAKVAQADIHPVPDLAQADLGRNDVQNIALRVPLADPNILVKADPPTVPVRIEKVVSRSLTVQVRFANEPPHGYQPGSPSLSSSEVRITGAQSLVASVAAVFATLRFGDTPIDISASADAVPVDAAGNPIEGLVADPPAVQVGVPVLSTRSTRTVPVLWSLRGNVAPGYWMSRVTTDPIAVEVQGTPETLAPVDRIDTAPIDVSGLTANRSFRVPLVLPDGVSLLQPTDATVGVTVIPLSGTRPFPVVAVQVTGAAAGLVGETDPATVSVVVAGPAATLGTLGPTDITATVDALGKGAGAFPADVLLRVPPGVTVISLQPSRVTLTMRGR